MVKGVLLELLVKFRVDANGCALVLHFTMQHLLHGSLVCCCSYRLCCCHSCPGNCQRLLRRHITILLYYFIQILQSFQNLVCKCLEVLRAVGFRICADYIGELESRLCYVIVLPDNGVQNTVPVFLTDFGLDSIGHGLALLVDIEEDQVDVYAGIQILHHGSG